MSSPLPALLATQLIGGHDKARIFMCILNGQAASRKDVARLLSMRSSSVSEHVNELLELRLLTETMGAAEGRGRPSLTLVANPNRLLVLVFQVITQSLHVVSVNLAGHILAHQHIEAPYACDNAMLIERFILLRQRITAITPKTSPIAGIAFSLSGLVDTVAGQWIFSSRWPQMQHLAITDIFPQSDCPLFLSRMMDAELRSRLLDYAESTLLLHWGYGIGTAFGVASGQLASGGSGFGEIGHWHMLGQDRLCHCGRYGCLETTAALWALGPQLLGEQFHVGDDEETVAAMLQSIDLMSIPAIKLALTHVVTALANLCRIFFPRRVVVSGPFVAHPQLWAALCEQFMVENRFVGLAQPELIAGKRSHEFEIRGAASPALAQALTTLLAPDTPIR